MSANLGAKVDPFFAVKLGPLSCFCLSAVPSDASIENPAQERIRIDNDSPNFPLEQHPHARETMDQGAVHDIQHEQDASEQVSVPADAEVAASVLPSPTAPVPCNGCGCVFNAKEAERSGRLTRDDTIQEHYKKTGFFGSVAGAFGDKKTMYCHHLTSDGELAARTASKQGKHFSSVEEVWAFLGKAPCHGRFAYDSASGNLKCGRVVECGHDKTCNPETCVFIANDLDCPVPVWALKG